MRIKKMGMEGFKNDEENNKQDNKSQASISSYRDVYV